MSVPRSAVCLGALFVVCGACGGGARGAVVSGRELETGIVGTEHCIARRRVPCWFGLSFLLCVVSALVGGGCAFPTCCRGAENVAVSGRGRRRTCDFRVSWRWEMHLRSLSGHALLLLAAAGALFMIQVWMISSALDRDVHVHDGTAREYTSENGGSFLRDLQGDAAPGSFGRDAAGGQFPCTFGIEPYEGRGWSEQVRNIENLKKNGGGIILQHTRKAGTGSRGSWLARRS